MKKIIIPVLITPIIISSLCFVPGFKPTTKFEKDTTELLKREILVRADKVLTEAPQTISMFVCSRSAGGTHDFYSEEEVIRNLPVRNPIIWFE